MYRVQVIKKFKETKGLQGGIERIIHTKNTKGKTF